MFHNRRNWIIRAKYSLIKRDCPQFHNVFSTRTCPDSSDPPPPPLSWLRKRSRARRHVFSWNIYLCKIDLSSVNTLSVRFPTILKPMLVKNKDCDFCFFLSWWGNIPLPPILTSSGWKKHCEIVIRSLMHSPIYLFRNTRFL